MRRLDFSRRIQPRFFRLHRCRPLQIPTRPRDRHLFLMRHGPRIAHLQNSAADGRLLPASRFPPIRSAPDLLHERQIWPPPTVPRHASMRIARQRISSPKTHAKSGAKQSGKTVQLKRDDGAGKPARPEQSNSPQSARAPSRIDSRSRYSRQALPTELKATLIPRSSFARSPRTQFPRR